MFSGIIETIGTILDIITEAGCKHFTIQPAMHFDDCKIGDSISVNGVCLTITKITAGIFHVTAVPETLRLTNLDFLIPGESVNLERSATFSSRISGHAVQGHVDGMGEILNIKNDNMSTAWLVKISVPLHLSKYLVSKGYIGLDGMSITVIDTTAEWFTVTFIPHTKEVTTTKNYKVGSFINIEVDMIAKYIEKLIGGYSHAISHQAS